MSSQWLATTWNIVFSTSSKSNLGLVKKQNWLLSAICHLNRSFINLKKVEFSVGQEGKNDLNVTFDNLNHRLFDFIKLHFKLVQRPKIIWEFQTRPCNIVFSNSPKSNYGMVKRPNMSSIWNATPWNIAFSTSSKTHFGLVTLLFEAYVIIRSAMDLIFLYPPRLVEGI